MAEELKRLGVQFKARRKELNLSLKEAENATSIRSSYLEAIEEGKINQFVAGVYAVGFIKQYATLLGLDIEKIIREHPQAFNMPAAKHEFSYGIGTLEVRGSLGGGIKWLPSMIWAGVSVVVIVFAWLLAKYLGVF